LPSTTEEGCIRPWDYTSPMAFEENWRRQQKTLAA
jgi:hypothetical protein